jgi:hypothetical protein
MIYTIFFPSGYSAPLSEILIHFDSLRSIDLPDSRSISKRDVYLLNFILQQQSTLEEIFYNWDVSKRPDGLRKIVKKSIIVR